MSMETPKDLCPRLCHVVRWEDFNGYGFNLHAEKGKAGQFIGKVDDHSPAEASGLKEGDRIVEVNGVNIGNENHQQVVTRIRQGGEETRLLVVDSASDDWFKDNKVVIRGDLSQIIFGTARRGEPDEEPERQSTPEPEPEPEPVVEKEEVESVEAPPSPSSVVAVTTNGNGVDTDRDNDPQPRLCHLKLWPHFQGYGFNLHAERDKPGQYIGLVDEDSPAQAAGLKVNDRIVEVNGSNVEREAHSGVIQLIKQTPGETRLLVVDPVADKYYKEKGVTVHAAMTQVDYIVTPEVPDTTASAELEATADLDDLPYEAPLESVPEDHTDGKDSVKEEEEEEEEVQKVEEDAVDGGANGNGYESGSESEPGKIVVEEEEEEEKKVEDEFPPPPPAEVEIEAAEPVVEVETAVEPEVEVEAAVPEVVVVAVPEVEEEKEEELPVAEETVNGVKKQEAPSPPEPEYTVAKEPEPTPAPAPEPIRAPEPTPAPAPTPAVDDSGLSMNMSVAEMKERLKAKKKQDPRHSKISFEKKYQQFERM